jgi:hypothetical protein
VVFEEVRVRFESTHRGRWRSEFRCAYTTHFASERPGSATLNWIESMYIAAATDALQVQFATSPFEEDSFVVDDEASSAQPRCG